MTHLKDNTPVGTMLLITDGRYELEMTKINELDWMLYDASGMYNYDTDGTFCDEEVDDIVDDLTSKGYEFYNMTDAYQDYDDSMDGDWDSGMASAGFGTDEDYGYYGEDDFSDF